MGTTGLNNMVVLTEPTEQQSVDYQHKVLIDEETQEVHRKLLEQIRENKERMKGRMPNVPLAMPQQPTQLMNYNKPYKPPVRSRSRSPEVKRKLNEKIKKERFETK